MTFLSSVAFAGDYALLIFYGFSKDGKYLAFEESGSWDGSGGDYSSTYIVETAKNSFAIAPIIYEKPDDPANKGNGFRNENLYNKSVAAKLKKFGIQRSNRGSLVVVHCLTI